MRHTSNGARVLGFRRLEQRLHRAVPESAEAIARFRERAVPLYEGDTAMLSFRGFREVESSIPVASWSSAHSAA